MKPLGRYGKAAPEMSPKPNHFDYVRLEDDVIFSVCGDVHPDGYLFGYPSYRPSEDGDRQYRGTRYEKFSRSLPYGLEADYYEQSEIDHTVVKFPVDLVAEVVPGFNSFEKRDLDETRTKIVEHFEDRLDRLDVEWTLTGSRLFDFETDSSDIDFFLTSNDQGQFTEFFDELHAEADPLPEATEEWIFGNYTDQYGLPRDIVRHHVESFKKRFYTVSQFPDLGIDGDMRISFIPGHVPGTWTDYYLPDGEYDTVNDLRGTVVDVSRSYSHPRRYRVRIDDESWDGPAEIDVLTFHWMYDGSFRGGEEVVLTGDLFEAEETVYLREYGHYIAPSEVADS